MEWEKNYTEDCIDILQPFGDVLEVGFGKGYAADRIASFKPKSHTIIVSPNDECPNARLFSLNNPNVKLLEASWQEEVSSLGVFDCIFFHPNTDEISKYSHKSQQKTNRFLKAGKALVANVTKKFAKLHNLRYSNNDIEFFLQKVEKKKTEEKKRVLPFFSELHQRGQITHEQFQEVSARLLERQWASSEDLATLSIAHKRNRPQDQDLLEFLEVSLTKLMKNNARFSCYLDEPTSKYEDLLFSEKIIENIALDYHEHWVEREPKLRGLVMLITYHSCNKNL